jgi:predicted PurR-regulated permease PerM
MSHRKFQVYFFVAVTIVSGILTLLVFRSYLVLLAFGGVLAVLFRPVYRRLMAIFRSPTAAAFLTVIAITLTILLPSAYFFAALYTELVGAFADAKEFFDTTTIAAFLEANLPATLKDQVPAVMSEALKVIGGIGNVLTQNLFTFFSNVFDIVFGFVVVLISVYYLLKDGAKVKKELLALSPLGDQYDELVFERIFNAVRAVMGGVIIIGLVKGVLAGIAFVIFGIPAPLFWGAMTGLASFIPLFGSALVTVPAILYLAISGKVGAAIGLAVVSVVFIGAIDNLMQPKLVESKTKIHPLLILLSILGGLEFYGFAGFILGPLTLAVTMALIDIYEREFRSYLNSSAAE